MIQPYDHLDSLQQVHMHLILRPPVPADTREPTQELSDSFTAQKTYFIFYKHFLLNLNAGGFSVSHLK